ncbi:MAG: hypothetical protein FH756_06090 [Firmicutes bacterium]|nr:hypothetical protein [Bacillota bacterium]
MCEVYTDKCTCPDCPDACRDLKQDLETCEAATPGPVAWQRFGGEYYLTGQYGMRPIILATTDVKIAGNAKMTTLSNRDAEKDLLIPLNPNHPDSFFIQQAWQGWPVAIRRALAAEEAVRFWQDSAANCGNSLDRLEKENAELRKALDGSEKRVKHLEGELGDAEPTIERLQAELDSSCDVARMRQLEVENAELREAQETFLMWDDYKEECECIRCEEVMPTDEEDKIKGLKHCPYCGRKISDVVTKIKEPK